jgi:hypothetical protein
MSDDHFSTEHLERFLLGTLPADETRAVVVHLARGCQRCRRAMAPLVELVLGGPPLTAKPASRASREQAGIARSPVRVATARPRAPQSRLGMRLCRALIARSEVLRHEDARKMVESAELACFVADNLDVDRYGALAIADLQARALAELANAHRVADNLPAAEALMVRALRIAELGSGDTFLLARLLDITASLAHERRQFAEALTLLDAVHALYAERGDTHRAGRALLSKGLYAGYAGDLETGLLLLLEGLLWIEPGRDPYLVTAGVHNLIWLLADDGRTEQAARLLELARPACYGMLNALKQRWLEGRIAAGLGRDEAAIALLSQVQTGFHEAGLGYCAAQVGLDLAALQLAQGESDAVFRLLGEALATFTGLRVGRDGTATLLLLAEAIERRWVTSALIDSAVLAFGAGNRPVRRSSQPGSPAAVD